MFRKLVSNLPFSPSLVGQLKLYFRKLKREHLSRQISLLFAVLIIASQLVSIVRPTQASLAASSNDIIFGGGTKSQMQSVLTTGCDNRGRCDVKSIYDTYGITETALSSANSASIHSDTRNDYWIVGRVPRGYPNETSIGLKNQRVLYVHRLDDWGSLRSWPALEVKTPQGTIWILAASGDIVGTKNQLVNREGIILAQSCNMLEETSVNQSSCFEQHTAVRNITQQRNNADKTIVHPSDTLEYTISIKNTGLTPQTNMVISQNMEDALEYSDIIDASGASFTQNPVKLLSWTLPQIKPGETIEKTVLIKVKNATPNTPASTSDPGSNDMIMATTTGTDSVRVRLPRSPLKIIEKITNQLPRTNLLLSLSIVLLFTLLNLYFYLRSNLLVKEVELIRQQFNQGNGA